MNEIRFYRASGMYGFLSNLHLSPITFDGRTFSSAEAAYQYGKPKDPAVAEWLANAPKPRFCALAAHALLPYDVKSDWKTTKVGRMRRVLISKFRQNRDLQLRLIRTGDSDLIETSNTDSFWGIGLSGHGENMLGKLLQAVRNQVVVE